MIGYSIHNLIDVLVDSSVPVELADAIEFQLGHFHKDVAAMASPQRIVVRPYERWSDQQPSTAYQFHLCRAGDGQWVDDPDKRLACMKDENGYLVYADTPIFLVNMLIQFLLVEQRITLVHAAAVADAKGFVTLLPGPGGVGKTALLGELVKKHGYTLLGDDIVGVTETGQCLAFPRSFVLKAYHESVYPEVFEKLGLNTSRTTASKPANWKKRCLNVLADNVPFKGILRGILRRVGKLKQVQQNLMEPQQVPYLATVPVTDVFGADRVILSGPIQHMIFMERWEDSRFVTHELSASSMHQRLFAIIHHEWTGHMRHFWTIGSVEMVNLPRYFQGISTILTHAIKSVPCQRMLIPVEASPGDLLEAFLADSSKVADLRNKAA